MKLKKIAIGVALASGTMAAQASDVLFFPYVVSGGSVTTLVSVLNKASPIDPVRYFNSNGTGFGAFDPNFRYLHWTFGVKTADTAVAGCEDRNGFFPTSPLDLVTYDVSTIRGNRGVIWESDAATSNVATGNNAFGSLPLQNERGILFVGNASTGIPVSRPVDQPLLTGEAIILEFGTGAAWGYQALERHDLTPLPGAPADPVSPGNNFLTSYDFSAVGLVDDDISFGPQSELTTRFFITPVNPIGGTMLPNFGGLFGSFQTVVSLTKPLGIGSAQTVFDRDESGFSSTDPAVVVSCTFPVDIVTHGNIPGLVTSPVVLPYVLEQGGWSHIATAGGNSTGNAVAIKLDFRAAGATGDMDPAGTGALNTSFMLNPRP